MDTLSNLILRYPMLEVCRNDVQAMCDLLFNCFKNGNRLYVCGNGGSASDALHIVGELVKSFIINRPVDKEFLSALNDEKIAKNLQGAFPAFALVENVALATAFANDVNPEYVFAQQVYAYACKGDCVLGISTSGNSKNVVHAVKVARAKGAATMALTGKNGGCLKSLCDCCVCVPETDTHKIQELHLPVYHAVCAEVERRVWG